MQIAAMRRSISSGGSSPFQYTTRSELPVGATPSRPSPVAISTALHSTSEVLP
jgi:hypothetical protein